MSNAFRFIVLTPPGLADPSLAIAASRAGALGVVNLEHSRSPEAAAAAVEKANQFARNPFGVRLGAGDDALLDKLLAAGPDLMAAVVLTATEKDHLRVQAHKARRQGLEVMIEVTSVEEALAAVEAGCDALIARGHEAGGRVGEECSFVLLQRLLRQVEAPVLLQGGIGLHTAAACFAAGAAGVVLDNQVLLARESPLSGAVKERIAAMDGSETVCLGAPFGEMYRVYARPGTPVVSELRELETALAASTRPAAQQLAEWREALRERLGWRSADEDLLPLGQDAAFAAPLARRFVTVGGILAAMERAIEEHCDLARTARPLDEGSPLARSHGSRYPIVQGPMTRVSDTAEFALSVAEAGALPFLALALMRGPQARPLLEETRERLGDKPWGVGILGFVPQELRIEQIEAIRACRPPFALIAGGRPDQARNLENEGIATYLHVPSPGLLRMFVQDGARRFVFEGRECGGHVGPRSSFVLWDTMVDVLVEAIARTGDPESYHVLFAGGIHDSLSASMVAAMAAPLARLGVRIGVLMGTGYLFTREAVTAGAITEGYQQEAMGCRRTVLLETGPGHSTRVIETPYTDAFQRKKLQLLQEGVPPEEVRNTLEEMNVGRLRMASKGIDRNPRYGKEPDAPEFVKLTPDEQRQNGTYMIGQAAALRDSVCSIAELHHEVSVEGSRRLDSLPQLEAVSEPEGEPSAVAIVGMGCILPGAPDLQRFWENIVNKVDAISEVPPERWDWHDYFDPDPKAKDKVYSKWGGFLDDVPFDPIAWGIPPSSLPSIEPVQLLTLEVVRQALKDAGYGDRPFDRERASVILGAGGGAGDVAIGYVSRSMLPQIYGEAAPDAASQLGELLPEWTEDSFAGILMNVAAGRVANRLDFGGTNCTIDAACASSLAAIHLAVKELETGSSDIVVAGGMDAMQSPFAYLCFSKTEALSPSGRCRPYDAGADGIAISEGLAAVVLKRLDDAERDGDRIYAVIRGVGSSSDGRSTGLTAPHVEGQVRSIERAYTQARVSPAAVSLIEGHGTGTVAGDQAEVAALGQVFSAADAAARSCALGSVKSMIGHTKCTAGVAGVIKASLALHHKVLPPTLNVTQPNPKAADPGCPFYVNTEPRPWIVSDDQPRYAGVSAFGFGGTNFHVVLEEYAGDYLTAPPAAPLAEWPAELLVWQGASREELLEALATVEKALAEGAQPNLADLACTLAGRLSEPHSGQLRLAIVAASLDDLRQKLEWAGKGLSDASSARIDDPRGIYFTERPLALEGSIAFLFPGQGSQYVNMLRDLAIQFPEVRDCFERADRVLSERLGRRLSSYIFPPPAFAEDEEKADQARLTEANIAQPAMGAANLAMLYLLKELGIEPEMTAGHSYGEFVALFAAGVLSEDDLYALSEARGRFFIEEAGPDPGAMAAVEGGPDIVAPVLDEIGEPIVIANVNSPRQTVISGPTAAVERAVGAFQARNIRARRLPVACAYHSPIVAPAEARLVAFFPSVTFNSPRLTVYSNTTAGPYASEPPEVAALLARQLASPVHFMEEMRAMYEAGARVFVEVGPRSVLAKLAGESLADVPHLSLSSDQPGRHGLVQLQHLLAQLATNGVPVQLDRLYSGRPVRTLDLKTLANERPAPLPATTWLVNGGGARPLSAPARLASATPRLQLTAPGAQATTPPGPATRAAPIAEPAPSAAAAGQPPAAAGQAAPDDAAQVMAQYQRLMNSFLETQKNVMLAYLQGAPAAEQLTGGPASAPPTLPVLPSTPVAPATEPRPAAEQPAEATPADASVPDGVPPPPAAPPAETPALPDRAVLTERLVNIISERTGYPAEFIELDADLEADLGIDSIKRVEILGSLKESLSARADGLDVDVETLSSAKTLRAIIDLIDNGNGAAPAARAIIVPSAPQEQRSEDRAPFDRHDQPERIGRYTLRPIEAPLAAATAPLPVGRTVVLTDDGNGVAAELARALLEGGCRPVVVTPGEKLEQTAAGRYTADLVSEAGVQALVEAVGAEHGATGGLVHLLPLSDRPSFDGLDLPGWRERLRLEVKSLFLLTRALAAEFAGGGHEGAFVIAATAMGGTFACGQAGDFFPGNGAVAGFLKTLAYEWPEVRVKAVDFPAGEPAPALAERLLAEICAADGLVEVGYDGPRRVVIETVSEPLDDSAPPAIDIDSSSVILLTGGARGITAEVARELAERYQPTLLLAGRTPLPGPEPDDTAGLASPQELKAALIERLRRAGEQVAPARVEEAYHRLLAGREVRANLDALEQAGARVHYYQADVQDEAALRALIDGIYSTFGRLDGVVHGAGLIEDKLVKDKAVDSFNRVFDTKTASAFTLSRCLRPECLKFLAFFSSVSARFGNKGQADYAAANEVLNKLAAFLDARWPARVVAMNWGPWLKGMVSAEVQKQFAERGIELIPPATGRRMMVDELLFGRKGQAEVVVGGGWPSAQPAEPAIPVSLDAHSAGVVLPMIGARSIPSARANGAREFAYNLDPALDLYLRDHHLDGTPVLPLAVAAELLAEAALAGREGFELVAVRDLQMLRGVTIENGAMAVRVAISERESSPDGILLDAAIGGDGDRQQLFYRAVVELRDRLPAAPPVTLPPLDTGQPAITAEEAYRDILFHGPLFQRIERLEAMGPAGASAIIRTSTPEECLAAPAGGAWLIDPIVIDCAMQLQLIWARLHWDITSLPARFDSLRRFAPLAGERIRCETRIRPSSVSPRVHADHYLFATDGRLLAVLEGVELVGNKALNRVAGGAANSEETA